MKTVLSLILALLTGCSSAPKKETYAGPDMTTWQAQINKQAAETEQGTAQFEKDLATRRPSGVTSGVSDDLYQMHEQAALRRSIDNVAGAIRDSSAPQYTPPVYIRSY